MNAASLVTGAVVGGVFVASILSDSARTVAKKTIESIGTEIKKQISTVVKFDDGDEGKHHEG